MQTMGRHYVQALNRQYNRTGTLWEGRYKSSLIEHDRYLLSCYRYIELNPVRAGMVRYPGAYRHSSYAHNALGRPNPVITTHSTYESLAETKEGRMAAYRNLFADELTPELLTLIRETTNACLILGNDKFKDQIEAMLGRRVRPGKAGRPRKGTN